MTDGARLAGAMKGPHRDRGVLGTERGNLRAFEGILKKIRSTT